MISLISQAPSEYSTERVMEWLQYLGADFIRLNGEDLNSGVEFAVRLGAGEPSLELEHEGRTVRGESVRAVWLRRWHALQNLEPVREALPPGVGNEVHGFFVQELKAMRTVIAEVLDGARWLTRPADLGLNKVRVLRLAAAAGLDVPATLVTNSRERVASFCAEHGRVISKPIYEAGMFQVENDVFATYTTEVTDALVERLPPTFFPSLLQALVPKRYELRVFYLAGECWPMAIFSQDDPRTAVDFRNYNHERPNRCVPFALPNPVRDSLRALMAACGLETGSVDLIRAADGRYVFLEVNPVGQFGMVSEPCNYRLERRVAEHLMELDDHER